jgi:hypothetical protein
VICPVLGPFGVIIVIPDSFLEVELAGEICKMIAPRGENASREPYRSSVKVVAGEGFEPPTLGL